MTTFRTPCSRSGAWNKAASAGAAGSARWMSRLRRGCILALALLLGVLGLINAAPAFAANAVNGDGTMTVSPSTVVAGSTGNQFTFTFKVPSSAAGKFGPGSFVTVSIPSGWTAPSTTATAAGYTTLTTADTSCSASISSISGGIITVNQSCNVGDGFTLTYGAGNNPTHVTAPTTPPISTFPTASRAGNTGTPASLVAGSPQVTVVVGSASQLAFTTAAPATGTSGSSLSTFRVSVQDSSGNTVASGSGSTDTITLSIASGPLGGTFAAGAVTSVNASVGVATFNGVTLTTVGSYTLIASDTSSTGITTATTGSIVISAGAGSKVAFVQGPSSGSAGVSLSPAITVQVQDSNGNAVTTSGVSVTLAVSAGVINSGATAITNGAGLATFGGVTINAAAIGLTMTASAAGLTATGASAPFNITVAVSNGAAALTDSVNDGSGSGVKTVSYYYCAGYTGSCTSATGTLIGTSATAAGNYLVTWSPQPGNGAYRLVVVGRDNVNNVSQESASIPVTVTN